MIIYKTTNLINGKFYIGKDEKNNPDYYGSGLILNRAIKKNGKENFVKEILEVCNDSKHLCEREIYWINELNSIRPNGYNIALGGLGGDTFTNNPNKDITRQKLSKTSTGRIWKEKSRIKASESRKKNLSAKPYDATLKEKIKISLLNKNLPNQEIQDEIIKLYLDPWFKLNDLYATYEITDKQLNYILKLNSINRIKRFSYQTDRYDLQTELNIAEDYKNGLSLKNINKKYSLGLKTIRDILEKYNVEIKQSGFKKLIIEK